MTEFRCPICDRLLLKMEWGNVSIKCKPCKRVWSFTQEAVSATAVR